jgi:hypothetical protein
MKDGQGADMAAVKLVSLRPAGDDLGKALLQLVFQDVN